MNRPATKSGKGDCVLYRRPRLSHWLDQPVKKALNESTKIGGEDLIKDGKPVNAWRCGAQRRRRSKLEGEVSWEGSERGRRGGSSRRQKEDDGEGGGAASYLYMGQAARWRQTRSGGLNRKRQRTGNQTTVTIFRWYITLPGFALGRLSGTWQSLTLTHWRRTSEHRVVAFAIGVPLNYNLVHVFRKQPEKDRANVRAVNN
jgi:hypothetical protein